MLSQDLSNLPSAINHDTLGVRFIHTSFKLIGKRGTHMFLLNTSLFCRFLDHATEKKSYRTSGKLTLK